MTSATAVLDRIQAKSAEFDLPRFLLTLVALPFFVLGWVVYHAWRVLCVVCGWAWAACVIGWEQARDGRREDGR